MAPPLAFTHAELRDALDVLYTSERAVRFQDVDAAGTVFFPRFFEYASDAYIELLARGGCDLAGDIAAKRWAAPLVHAEADFHAPLRFGDALVAEVVRARVGTTSYTLGFRVRAQSEPSRVCATVITVHVSIDPATFKPAPVPDAVRRALTETSRS